MLCDDVRAALLLPEGPLPEDLTRHAASCASCAAVIAASAGLDGALRSSLVVEAPPALAMSLAALAVRPSLWARFLALIQRQLARPWVLGAEVASFAVLVYALAQLFGWLAAAGLVLGDVPYAIELLVLSPALDYLSQISALVQQLGLWAIVAAVGWLLAQGMRIGPLQRPPTPA